MTCDTLPPSVDAQLLGELPVWRVRHAGAELWIARQGAQILRYQRDGEPPLIWQSEEAAFAPGQPVRGGVPVCWPWFGDLARNPDAVCDQYPAGAPFHGLARSLDWRLDSAREDGDGVELVLAIDARADLAGWPPATSLSLTVRLDARLHIELSTRNDGDAPVAISQALHTYFAVGDVREVGIAGLDGCRYIETLDNWQERRQRGELAIGGETDRIYLDLPARLTLIDRVWRRRIQLETRGSRSAVVWNPWIDKAARLSQFAPDAWQRMLCIETANVWNDTVTLAPGERHSLGLTLWSETADA